MRDLAARGLNALWYGGNRLYWLLWPAAVVVRGLAAARRFAYRRGWLASFDVGVPVVVIGNLTVGGTGKTPVTLWLAEALGRRGFSPGIVCSGYGGQAADWPRQVTDADTATEVGDEASLLARRAARPVVAAPDRVAAARRLLDAGDVDVILADDGLQHYRLRRAVEIAVVDGTRGLGNGLCLPAGPLREPASRLELVDAVVVNQGTFGLAGEFRARLRTVRVYELATGLERALDDFAGRTVHAVAAIGNPGRFFDALTRAGLIVERHALPDHASLGPMDLRFDDDTPVLITEKDAVKCERLPSSNLWCVVTELEFEADDGDRFERLVLERLERQAGNR